MAWVAGLDGCRNERWIAVLVECSEHGSKRVQHTLCKSFKEIDDLAPEPDVIAVDIPIGLLEKKEKGGRECDRLARRALKRPRASSVFSPPTRPALRPKSDKVAMKTYGLNLQAAAIRKRIAEVDRMMAANRQKTVYEVHPEVCFWAMNKRRAMKHNKETKQGREERLRALVPHFPGIREQARRKKPQGVATDDLLDAYAAAWTAMRIAVGESETFPPEPPRDSKGLRIEIRY